MNWSESRLIDHGFYVNVTIASWIRVHPMIYCVCLSRNSSLGLWKAGMPNTISIDVSRIGYLTMSDNSIVVHKDGAAKTAVDVQLGKYDDGFLYNSIVPVDKLPQTNLFLPKAPNSSV